MATFQSIWADFKASTEYQQLKTQYDQLDGVSDVIQFNWDNLNEMVGNQLDSSLSDYIGKPRADWTAASIGDYLTQAMNDDNIDDTQFLAEGPVVIGEPYCTYLARTKQINAKPADILKTMAGIKKAYPEVGNLSDLLSALFSTSVETEGFLDDDDFDDDDFDDSGFYDRGIEYYDLWEYVDPDSDDDDFDDIDFDQDDFWNNVELDDSANDDNAASSSNNKDSNSADDVLANVLDDLDLDIDDFDQDESFMMYDDFDVDPSAQVNRDPKLSMWQLSRLTRIKLQYSKLMKDYQERPEWQARSKAVTGGLMEDVVELLLTIGYNRYRKLPRSWTKHVLVEIMSGDLVEYRFYTQEQYEAIGPLLTDFIGFAGANQLLKPAKVTQLQRYIQSAAAKMVAAAKVMRAAKVVGAGKNPDIDLPDKKLMAKKQAASVDLDDDESTKNYLIGHQDDIEVEHDDDFPITVEVLDDPQQLATAIDYYNPDKVKHYLLPDEHDLNIEGRSWNREDAIKAHRFAVELAFRAYVDQKQANPETTRSVVDYVETFACYLGNMYDFELLMPAQLTTEVLKKAIMSDDDQIIDHPGLQNTLKQIRRADLEKLLVMVDTLQAYTALPKQRAKALKGIIQEEQSRFQ
ncbi:hypothetical protein [Lactiplantibacillus pentosus]|uniref:hypothetical protein n=1 Tax=Lactiplantibacillus pentosus TaxID=1589 RepID=UPI0021820AE0|nr:hypothetical protein [Lactiplantibacillus pentosus]MCT0161205.1 hypothetical protein [Lactiplantibacillus pentosus]